jgi:PAS domain S-box-containing protein
LLKGFKVMLMNAMLWQTQPPPDADEARSFTSALTWVARKAAIAVVLLGSLATVGWLLRLEILKTLLPGFLPLRPSVALCLILLGLTLRLHHRQTSAPDRSLTRQKWQRVLISLVACISLTYFAVEFGQLNTSLDQWLLQSYGYPNPSDRTFWMPFRTAVALLMFSSALLLLQLRWFAVAQLVGILAFLPGVFCVIDCSDLLKGLYPIAISPHEKMSLLAVVSLTLLALAVVFAQPDRGIFKPLSSSHAGGMMARRLLPVTLTVPFLLELITLWAYRNRLVGLEAGTVLETFWVTLILSGLLWWNASRLNVLDRKRQRLQQAYNLSESLFRSIFEQASQVNGLLSPDGTILKVNQTALALFNRPSSALVGQAFESLADWSSAALPDNQPVMPADSQVQDSRNFSKTSPSALNSGRASNQSPPELADQGGECVSPIVTQLRAAIAQAANGETVYLETALHPAGQPDKILNFSLKPLLNQAGAVELLILEGQDITEQQAILRQREQMEQALRQSQEQLEQRVEARTAQLRIINELLSEEIQRSHRARAALKATESRLSLALDATQIGIWDLNLKTNTVIWMKQTEALFGIPEGSFNGTMAAFLAFVHADDRDRLINATTSATLNQTPLQEEYRILDSNGRLRWLKACGQVFQTMPDGFPHLIGTVADITQQKQAEADFCLTQAIAQAIVEAPSLAAALEAIVCQLCEAIDWNFAEVWIPDVATQTLTLQSTYGGCNDQLDAFVESSKTFSFTANVGLPGRVWATKQPEWILAIEQAEPSHFLRRDLAAIAGLKTVLGIPILIEAEVFAVLSFYSFNAKLRDNRSVQLVNQIIHELGAMIQRKQAQEELRTSYNLLRAIVEGTPDCIFVKDLQRRYRLVNSPTERIFGQSAADLIGRTDAEILSPQAAAAIIQADDRVFALGSTETVEEIIPQAGVLRHFLSSKTVWRNTQGEVMGLIGIARDITEQVETAQRISQLNQELEQRVRDRTSQLELINKELETFSYSVSHDLRSPLRGIEGFSQALLKRCHDQLDSQSQHYIARIQANTQRMNELINDLLELSRVTRGQLQRQTVNLSQLAQEIADQLTATQPDRVVTWTIASGIMAECDFRLLKIVLHNLLENAWKYSSRKPQAQIAFGICPLTDLVAVESAAVQPIAYFVRDNGAGFNMAYANKLFGAFQRLHSEAEFPGTGVGLATIARIVHRHGGIVGAIGAVEEGATFYFTLEK